MFWSWMMIDYWWEFFFFTSLNATDFLERLRRQKIVFVGDSLNRNMWESLVCILRQSITNKKRVHEISGRTEFKKKGVYSFRFEASFWYTEKSCQLYTYDWYEFCNVLCISSWDCFFMQCRIIIVQLTLSVRHSSFENQLTKGKMDLLRH